MFKKIISSNPAKTKNYKTNPTNAETLKTFYLQNRLGRYARLEQKQELDQNSATWMDPDPYSRLLIRTHTIKNRGNDWADLTKIHHLNSELSSFVIVCVCLKMMF